MESKPDNGSMSEAASRARELLAAREAESLLTMKERIASPRGTVGISEPRRIAGKVNVRTESVDESSSRVREILESMKEKREVLTSAIHQTPSRTAHLTSEKPPPKGTVAVQPISRPPLFSASEREAIATKMSESLKEKRERIIRLLSPDQHKQRISSTSPHTVETATTAEDSLSSGGAADSWAGDSVASSLVLETLAPPPSLQEIEETFNEESSIEPNTEGSSTVSSEKEESPMRPLSSDNVSGRSFTFSRNDALSATEIVTGAIDHVEIQGSNNSTWKNFTQGGTTRKNSSDRAGEKKVSFDDALFVIEEMMPPSVVHCTSFDSAISKDRSLSGYAPDDLTAFLGCSTLLSKPEIAQRRRTSSWDASDIDENEARKDRYISLLTDHKKRLNLMRKLEETYSELVILHQEIESKRKARHSNSEDDSDYSHEGLDDESSYEFTNDSNTSGWLSRDESNSKLDSLLQYMTSEDDDSLGDSHTSEDPSSHSFLQTNNLDTLLESDETEVSEEETKLAMESNRSADECHESSEDINLSRCSLDHSSIVVSSAATETQEDVSRSRESAEVEPHDTRQEENASPDPVSFPSTDKTNVHDDTNNTSFQFVSLGENLLSKPAIRQGVRESVSMNTNFASEKEDNAESCHSETPRPVVSASGCAVKKRVHDGESRTAKAQSEPRKIIRTHGQKPKILRKSTVDSEETSQSTNSRAKLKGIVKREIKKWENASPLSKLERHEPETGAPGTPLTGTMTPEDVSLLCYINLSETIEDVAAEVEPEEERDDVPTGQAEPSKTPNEESEVKKSRRRPLFVPRKESNKRCFATGGLLDLAQKTGISEESTIYVKAVDVPRPPEIAALNAEFKCGTQGSLYNLALRSGCKIDTPPTPKRLKMPPLRGEKKRWLLKARGGHYHISVWTTISNAVLTARVGFSVQDATKGIKGKIEEERHEKEVGARGLRHVIIQSDWL